MGKQGCWGRPPTEGTLSASIAPWEAGFVSIKIMPALAQWRKVLTHLGSH